MSFEITLMEWIQRFSGHAADLFNKLLSFMGGELFVVAVIASIYWCLNKEWGVKIGYAALFSACLNGILKDAFRRPRPIGVGNIRSPGADELFVEHSPTGYPYSYSFPSGHSQNAGVLSVSLAQCRKKRRETYLYLGVGLLVCLSRLYLGVHWPTDVAAGFLIGSAVSLLLFTLVQKSGSVLRLYVAGFFAAALFGILFAATDDTVKALGALCGFVIGHIFEQKWVNFAVEGTVPKRLLRAVLGLLFVVAIMALQKMLLPQTLPFYFVRYTVNIFSGIALWPLIFKKINL